MTDSTAFDRLGALARAGVSIWLDDLSRELLAGGELATLIAERHVVGVTTNPTIFAAALAHGDRYTDQLRDLAAERASVDDAVFTVTSDDVRAGCRVLRPVHDRTDGVDGRVSIEVDPRLARDTAATITQARALWAAVDEPNLFIKIPATAEGLPAITAVVAEGISVNVTLIFSLERYLAVVAAYATGLEQAHDVGIDLSTIHSVASFFVSRVDTEVDARLDAITTPDATALKGRAAIANARLAYHAFENVLGSSRWQHLAVAGARAQRPLWASTGVKNPAYPDTMYVSELVAAQTVNTMPRKTLDAFADHGTVTAAPIETTYRAAREHFDSLARAGVDFDAVTDTLERDGLSMFERSWDELGQTVARELHAVGAGRER